MSRLLCIVSCDGSGPSSSFLLAGAQCHSPFGQLRRRSASARSLESPHDTNGLAAVDRTHTLTLTPSSQMHAHSTPSTTLALKLPSVVRVGAIQRLSPRGLACQRTSCRHDSLADDAGDGRSVRGPRPGSAVCGGRYPAVPSADGPDKAVKGVGPRTGYHRALNLNHLLALPATRTSI